MKILVNVPSKYLLGGVSSHYWGLKRYWKETFFYNVVGRRYKFLSGIYFMPYDILKFVFKLIWIRPNIVLLNPSLNKSALIRDFIFLNIACFFNFKVGVFIHGFNIDNIKENEIEGIVSNLNKANFVIVLANGFREILLKWGVRRPIELSTTKVPDNYLSDFNIECRNRRPKNILFLSRIEKAKGIYEAINAFKLLSEKGLTMTIVGDGSELFNVEQYVKDSNIKGVNFRGKLVGEELLMAYREADLYLFPSYTEGMPATVLEAMTFGLPIITSAVGGLLDFFENGKMGFMLDDISPDNLSNYMDTILSNQALSYKISRYNREYSAKHFIASKVADLFEKMLNKYL